MTGIQKIFEDLQKKHAVLKKDYHKLSIQFEAFKMVVAKQITEFSTGMNKVVKGTQIFAKGVEDRFKVVEANPCMAIKTVFTEGQIKKLLKLVK